MKLPVVGQLLVEPAVAEGYFNRIFARNEQGGNVKIVVVDGFIVGGKGRSQQLIAHPAAVDAGGVEAHAADEQFGLS